MGQDEEVVAIGIGKDASADVTVRWPNGAVQNVGSVAAGAIVEIKQPQARPRRKSWGITAGVSVGDIDTMLDAE